MSSRLGSAAVAFDATIRRKLLAGAAGMGAIGIESILVSRPLPDGDFGQRLGIDIHRYMTGDHLGRADVRSKIGRGQRINRRNPDSVDAKGTT